MLRHRLVPMASDAKFGHLINIAVRTKARLIISTELSEEGLRVAKELGIPFVLADQLETATGDRPNPEFSAAPNQICVILPTSGSSGYPKLVPLSHSNLLSGANSVVSSLRLIEGETCLVLWKQHHIGGLVDLLLAPLISGGTILNGGEFSGAEALRFLSEQKPDWIQFVPATMRETITRIKAIDAVIETPPRFVRCVGATLDKELWSEAESAIRCPVVHTYGLTEASPLVSSTTPASEPWEMGSAGVSCNTEVRLIPIEHAPPGHEHSGEIAIRGPGVFAGYFDSESGTACFTEDRFFRTGDTGFFDSAGNLVVAGRISNDVNRGGIVTNLDHVEASIARIAPSLQLVAYSFPHKTLGSDFGCLYVETDLEGRQDLLGFLRSELPSNLVPSEAFAVAALPLGETGKPDRELARQIATSRKVISVDKPEAIDEIWEIVSKVWAEELDSSPESSFVRAGGDSLSAVRIVASLQDQLKINLNAVALFPEDTAITLTQKVSGQLPISEPTGGLWGQTPDPGDFKWFGGETAEDLFKSLENLNDVDFARRIQSGLSIFTLEELRSLASYTDELTTAQHLEMATRLLGRWISFSEENTGRVWNRKKLAPSVMDYATPSGAPGGLTLIAFSGNQGRLMIPISAFLAAAPDSLARIVVVDDPKRKHFEDGVEGVSDTAAELTDALLNLIGRPDSKRLVFMGTSAGGLMAYLGALSAGADRAALVSPDSLRRHFSLELAVRREKELGAFLLETRIISGRSRRDLAGVIRGARLDNSRLRIDWSTSHNVLSSAVNRSHLKKLLKWLLD